MSKRKVVISIVLFLIILGACTYLYSRYVEPQQLVNRKVNVGSNVAMMGGKELRIVQFSDTHIGTYYSERKLSEVVTLINAQNPDIVVFTGDLFDTFHLYNGDTSDVISVLSKINAPIGKFAVFGNHDYGGGAVRIYEQLMTECGFTVLKNEIVTIGNISIGGMDDWLMGDPDYSLTQQFADDTYNLLLSHAPDAIDKINLDNVSLALSGHTHGGQVYVPFATQLWLPIGGQNYRKGIYDLTGSTMLNVTSGIGTTKLPFRLFNPPEIVTIDVDF